MTGSRLVIVGLVLAAAAAIANAAPRIVASNAPSAVTLESVPMAFAGWRGHRDPDLQPDVTAVLGADQYLLRTYEHAGAGPVRLYIAFYATQRRGGTMHSPLNCLPGSGWDPIERTYVDLGAAGRAPISINRYIVQKGIDRQAVFYWFQSGPHVVANEYASKFYLLRDALTRGRDDAALVRVMTPFDAKSPAAAHVGLAFARDLYPLLTARLGG